MNIKQEKILISNTGKFFLVSIVFSWLIGLIFGFKLALILLTLIGFGAALIGLFKPTVGVIGIGMLCALDALTRVYLLTGGILRWNSLSYWLLIVIFIFSPFLLRLKDAYTTLLKIFIILLSLQLLMSSNLLKGLQHILNILIVFGILVYFVRAIKKENIWYLLAIINGTLAAIGGLVFYIQKTSLAYINPNAFAYFPLTAIFTICLGYNFITDYKKKFLLIILVLINFFWIFLSASRGSILVALFCLLFILVISQKKISQKIFYVGFAILILFLLATQFTNMQEYAINRIDKLFFDSSYTLSERTSYRSDIAIAGLYMFLEHPFGIGTGSFSTAYLGRELEIKEAHSVWIKILVENGIIGIILFTAFILSFALVNLRKKNKFKHLLGIFVTIVLSIAFISTEFQSKGLWFLTAGAIVLLNSKLSK